MIIKPLNILIFISLFSLSGLAHSQCIETFLKNAPHFPFLHLRSHSSQTQSAQKKISKQEKFTLELDLKVNQLSLPEALDFITINILPLITIESLKKNDTIIQKMANEIKNFHPSSKEYGIAKRNYEDTIVQKRINLINKHSRKITAAFNYLIETKNLNAQNLSQHLFKSPFFLSSNKPSIYAGIQSFFNGNYLISSTLLSLQIEPIIRNIITHQIPSHQKPTRFKSLSSLLSSKAIAPAFESLDPNIHTYFRSVLTDEKMFNARNIISHGVDSPQLFTKKISAKLIHLLLILSTIK